MKQLILLVDALGWLTVERTKFLHDLLPHRRRVTTVFGYSSTAIPTLITGAWPRDHGRWFLYRRAAPGASPFREAAWITRLPGGWKRRWRLRMKLQEYWRKRAGIRGYFSLYNVPLEVLPQLEPVEIKDTWGSGSFPHTPSLVDFLEARGKPYFLSDWREPDARKIERARAALESEELETVVLYLTEIDATQHRVGTLHPELDRELEILGGWIRELVEVFRKQGEVGISLFSDHGMTDIERVVDLLSVLAEAGLERGRDYEGFFDSTVARFWNVTTPRLTEVLNGIEWGKVLGPRQLEEWGVNFPEPVYGEVFFLVDPGLLIVPSDMGSEPLAAMHGYDPAHPTSDACFLTDREVPLDEDHLTAVFPALRRRLDPKA